MTHLPSAVFLDLSTLDRDDLDLTVLRAATSHLATYPTTAADQRVERIGEHQVAITNKVVIDAHVMQACPQLKLILTAATGTNNVDLDAARQRGITVCNCQAYGTSAVAQHTLMLMLVLLTRFERYRDAVRAGAWQRSEQFCLLDYPIGELAGRSLGILGYGELGRAVARLAEAFGMTVLVGALPGRERSDRLALDELLSQADVLSLHCPLTDTTRGLISERELALMKPGSFLINAARGGLVDEPALLASLTSGHLAGAAVDVLSQEPPREGNVLLDQQVPNLIVTPHSAWGSREARQRIVEQLAENVQGFTGGATRRTVS